MDYICSVDCMASFNVLVGEKFLDRLPLFLFAHTNRRLVSRVVAFRRRVRVSSHEVSLKFEKRFFASFDFF